MSIRFLGLCLVLFLSIAGCGNKGGTETGSTTPTPIDADTYSANIESVASTLIPDMNPDGGSESVSVAESINYASSEDWDYYALTSKADTLYYIFGDPDKEPNSETKIRYAVRQVANWVDEVLTNDPSVQCEGASNLNEGDTLNIPFFGEIENGSSTENRYFDCIYESEWISDGGIIKILYGVDESAVLHFVVMTQNEGEVDADESVSVHGTANSGSEIYLTSYSENSDDDGGSAYLDIQYAKLLVYTGDDEELFTDDDFVFKMRSRVTGTAELNADGDPVIGSGDFTVTKYDENLSSDQLEYTMALGRGSYDDGDFSIFKMDTSSNPDYDGSQVFCLETDTDEIPAYADPTNCTGYEDTYAWSDSEFPFNVVPSLEEIFEDKPYYELGDTDLIANDGSNFIIPEYETL
ncbi:MAG: hypothetical protein HN337_04630 [Deltaproteobacteria bacterium]|nr:hypothetical protein [Deltaproteobacteria bacterium]